MMAETARDQFTLQKVLFITSPSPPHKKLGLLEAEHRHELVVAAITGNNHFEASRIELQRKGPSYTVDTMRQLAQDYPACRLNLIVGQDNVSSLAQWHEAESLFRMCRLLVAPRVKQNSQEITTTELPHLGLPEIAQVELMDFPLIPISSSSIRKRLQEKRSIRYLVPDSVHRLLLEKKHYVSE